MTSLLGKLVRLFPDSVPLEDLFTEAVARLFERNPDLCAAWLESAGLLPRAPRDGDRYVRVSSQRPFAPLEHHDTASRPDLLVEVYHSSGENPEGNDPIGSVVMVESKIGSVEGPDQLRRYADHLGKMEGFGDKTLLYVTRAYDPKDEQNILSGSGEDVRFEQLRWHDFYRFLREVAEKDALVEEVMVFMEEQGMAARYRFSSVDLMALSGLPRAFEIFDETLGGKVRAELESFAMNKIRREADSLWQVRNLGRYHRWAPLHDQDLFCAVGWQLRKVDDSTHASVLRIAAEGYPAAFVFLESRPGAEGREASVAAMKQIALNEEWEPYNLDDPSGWAGVRRVKDLAEVLPAEDHVAAVQRFFVESIHQLREQLKAFKKDHPELPWHGEDKEREA